MLSECFNNILQQTIDDSKIMYSKFQFIELFTDAVGTKASLV